MIRPKLAEVLDGMVREGELTDHQRAHILGRMGPAGSRPIAALLITVLASFGAVLFAMGVLYLIGYNWWQFSPPTQLTIVGSFWLGVHLAAALCSHAPGRYPRVGQALELLALLLFIGAVGLVAQIYHIESEEPWVLFAWWLCYLPLLLWRGTLTLLMPLTAIFFVWAIWHSHEWLLPREGMRYSEWGVFYLVTGLGALFSALAVLSSTTARARFAVLWAPLGTLAGFFGLYLMSFQDAVWLEGPKSYKLVPTGLAVVWSAAALFIAWRRKATALDLLEPSLLAVAALLGPILIWGSGSHGSFVGPLLGNLLTLGYLIFLVWRGLRRAQAAELHLALGLFALLVVTRYLEYLWDKLEGAYAFLATGALLLSLGWFLEWRRRELLRRIA
jgi:uncharacterized membrane protein